SICIRRHVTRIDRHVPSHVGMLLAQGRGESVDARRERRAIVAQLVGEAIARPNGWRTAKRVRKACVLCDQVGGARPRPHSVDRAHEASAEQGASTVAGASVVAQLVKLRYQGSDLRRVEKSPYLSGAGRY